MNAGKIQETIIGLEELGFQSSAIDNAIVTLKELLESTEPSKEAEYQALSFINKTLNWEALTPQAKNLVLDEVGEDVVKEIRSKLKL